MGVSKMKINILIVFGLFTLSCSENKPITEITEECRPKNIILLIGDGMGLSQVSTAFFYQNKVSNFQRFETIGLIKTSSFSHKITDSAAGATAFFMGTKTFNGGVGVNSDSLPQKTIVQLAEQRGMKTGLIATSSITHATPAAFYAHVKSRKLQEEIATWLPESGLDYFAAGGLKFFNQRKDGVDQVMRLKENGFEIDTTGILLSDELSVDKKYGLLLASDEMPKMSEGRGDFLPKATRQALSYLSNSKEGFFLLVEGSQIDWGGHTNDAEYIINEVIDFDKTLGVALDFAARDGNTLVIVTADHETGGFTLASTTKVDKEGIIRSDYDSITPVFSTKGHSATLIPVFAYGVGSGQFSGIYENIEIFHRLKPFLLDTK